VEVISSNPTGHIPHKDPDNSKQILGLGQKTVFALLSKNDNTQAFCCFGGEVAHLHVLAVPGIEWLQKLQPIAVGVHCNFSVATRWCLVGFLTCGTGF